MTDVTHATRRWVEYFVKVRVHNGATEQVRMSGTGILQAAMINAAISKESQAKYGYTVERAVEEVRDADGIVSCFTDLLVAQRVKEGAG